ncbi:hypothetical protein [Roseateles depolymerans]|uniref:Uncharacterized protein n=1 Tax=Roseateles depolymerans TaxID=76731 RepID=A0A0U3LV33_9BURK|nr:hypothetical protein [Roseateles depolymerans]ALV08951.1 hypothetical protein RD2015_4510 [Roseateles depolymerans]REG09387.1 hypothetical protein DES44_4800 [Roseateles depolymerans]
MATYDLYGSPSEEFHQAKKVLESALEVKFKVRESEYHGGEYFQWGMSSGENFVLKRNLDPIDGDPAEISFPVYNTLLYLNNTPRSKELQEKIRQRASGFVALRHEDLA